MKKINVILLVAFVFFTFLTTAQPDIEISNQKPGFCYAKCLIHDEYRTQTDQILVKVASSKVEIIPAKYETVSEQVIVKEAATRLERIPSEYESVTHSFVKGCPIGNLDLETLELLGVDY